MVWHTSSKQQHKPLDQRLILIIVFIAFLIGKNLENLCTVWFFSEFQDISVIVLIFVAFCAGVLTALLFMLFAKVIKYSKQKNTATTEIQTVKERKIKKDKKKIGLLKKAEKINEKTDEPAEN